MSTIKIKTKLVKPSFSISIRQEQKCLIDYIIDELKGVDISSMKLDPEFLKYIAELIENQVNKTDTSDSKPDKMDIFIEVMKRLFPVISDSEIQISRNIVEYLLKNKLIKKTKLSKIITFFLKKKFLNLV